MNGLQVSNISNLSNNTQVTW
uniref:Uncharacterized protein n=1 Tax=Arundo donax TaxID=35708 RepID=A0A0A8Y7R9_ARUDO